MFLHSDFSAFEYGSSCHYPDQENLSNLGLIFKRNGNFCLYLLASSCHLGRVSTQRAMPAEVNPHGEALEDEHCRGPGRHDAKEHQDTDLRGDVTSEGVLWPSHACWRHVDRRRATWTSPP